MVTLSVSRFIGWSLWHLFLIPTTNRQSITRTRISATTPFLTLNGQHTRKTITTALAISA
nr:MAG TPA: TMEM213 family [Caudoviricetes sp.]